MEPRRYGQRDNEDDLPVRERKPMWKDALDSYGPSLTLAGILLAALMGWVPSKLMDGMERTNALLMESQKNMAELPKMMTAVADMAKALTAQNDTITKLQRNLVEQSKWNRTQCRALAKALKNGDMNEKCDEL